MSKDAVEKVRAAQETLNRLMAQAATQPVRPAVPAPAQGPSSILAAAQAAANALAQKVCAPSVLHRDTWQSHGVCLTLWHIKRDVMYPAKQTGLPARSLMIPLPVKLI